MAKPITLPTECQLLDRGQVCIAGGGLAGVAAALTAAAAGLDTILVEERGALGWEISHGLEQFLTPGAKTPPLLQRIVEALAAQHATRDGMLDPAATECLLDRMLCAAKVRVHFRACADSFSGGLLRVTTKSGPLAIQAPAVIDATENARLARAAGGAFQTAAGAGTVCTRAFLLCAVEPPARLETLNVEGLTETCTRPTLWPHEAHVRLTCKVSAPECAESESRWAIARAIETLRKTKKGFEKASLSLSAHEFFARQVPQVKRDSLAAGLFVAGPALLGRQCTLEERTDLGEQAATAALAYLRSGKSCAAPERQRQAQASPVRTNRLPAEDARGQVTLPLTEIRQAGSFDVVVVGGGTGGAPAAIVAGQEGLTTAVIEPQSFLGGIGTGGGIHYYYHGVQAGVQIDIDQRTQAWTDRIGGKAAGFHPEAKKLALQELADAAGVRCFYHSFFLGVVMDGNAVKGVVAAGPEGLFWVAAKVVIDCTGDADAAAAAGAPFHFGRDGDHAPQAYSLAPGRLSDAETVAFSNFDAGYVDPTNALDQSRAHFESRGHLHREQYNAANRVLYISPILGLRESRFIDAEYVLTLADQQTARRFPAVVARAIAHYDNHSPDYENESAESRRWVAIAGQWHTQMYHDVPYGCLVPRQVENVLVACRAAGMTHDAHNLWRMQRDMQALGEAAGVAAAQAIRSGATVRRVDVKAVQARLVARHALPAEALAGQGCSSVLPADTQSERATLAQLFATFGSKAEPSALREMLRRGAAIHRELRAALKDADPNQKLLAALALGLQGLTDGVEVLKQTLAARRADQCEAHRCSPRWMSALFLLDQLGLRECGAIGLTAELLKDQPLDIHKATAAVRALGRHATAEEACEAIRAVLRRTDIAVELTLQHSQGERGKPIVSNRRFELDLSAAQALAKFGAHDEAAQWVQRHLNDERALVRGYARRVQAEVEAPALVR